MSRDVYGKAHRLLSDEEYESLYELIALAIVDGEDWEKKRENLGGSG